MATRPSRKSSRRISSQRAELASLRVIGRALGSGWDVEATLHTITKTTAKVMRMDSCSIYLLDRDGEALILKASTGLAGVNQARLRLGEGITGHAAKAGKPFAVRDAAHNPRFKFLPETREQDFKSLLAVPLVSQGKLIGAMNVQTRRFHHYSESEVEFAALVGDFAAGALDRAVQFDELQRQLQELAALSHISKTLTASVYLDDMLRVIVEMAAKIMRARATALLLLDAERSELVLRASFGLSPEHLRSLPLDTNASLTGQTIISGEPIASRDVWTDPRYQNRELAKKDGLHAFLSVPLRFRGRIIGGLNCYMESVHDFSPNEVRSFVNLANQTAIAIEHSNLAMNVHLVREMHHRVKNNLQTIAMLLRLQLRQNGNQPSSQVLTQTMNRILSIAAVHEALSGEGTRTVELKTLIEQAANVVKQNMIQPGQEIRIEIIGDEIELPSHTATSLALVANELLQNAIEHGYSENGKGLVSVALIRLENEIALEVADDGKGLTASDITADSLGLEIVRALVTEDLRGTLEMTNNPTGKGTRVMVRVPN